MSDFRSTFVDDFEDDKASSLKQVNFGDTGDDAFITLDDHMNPAPDRVPKYAHISQNLHFLMDEGVSGSALAQCVQTAIAWQVEPLEALIALNIMDAQTLYRAIARHLNCRFITHASEVLCTLPTAIRIPQTGILPVRVRDDVMTSYSSTRFVIAPQGKHLTQLASLIRQRRNGVLLSPDIQSMAMTTPAILRSIARAHNPVMIAHVGANELPDYDPKLSIRDGLTPPQKRFAAIFFGFNALIALVILLHTVFPSFISGSGWHTIFVQVIGLLVPELLTLSVLFLMLIILRLSASIKVPRVDLPVADAFVITDHDLPIYTLLIPLYREYQVLPQLLGALSNLNYPSAKLDVKIIVEEGDILTREALGVSNLPSFIDVVVAPDGKPRTKPRALNIALKEARGDFLVIYDAEDVPDPLQLRHAVRIFARSSSDVACLQARLVIDNTHDSWLTRFFTIEYCQLFDAFNPMLARMRLPIPLGGTSNHFRTAVLRDIMGWDAWNVTEDADLGFRLMQKGYAIADLPSSTYEEAPSEFKAWLYQRTRWLKGWMQVSITHSRHPVVAVKTLGLLNFLAMMALSFGTVLTALLYPFLTLAGLYVVVMGFEHFHVTPYAWLNHFIYAHTFMLLFLGLIAMILPARAALKRRSLDVLLPYTWLLPFYYILISCAAWCALVELIRAPFQWNKTTHGKAKTSRTGRVRVK